MNALAYMYAAHLNDIIFRFVPTLPATAALATTANEKFTAVAIDVVFL
jgi:hypothetical protein